MPTFTFVQKCDPTRKSKHCNVFLRYYHGGGNPTLISTTVNIQKSYWSKKTQRVKSSHPDYQALNERLDFLQTQIQNVLTECYKGRIAPTKQFVKKQVLSRVTPKIIKENFFEYYQNFLDEKLKEVQDNKISHKTFLIARTTRNALLKILPSDFLLADVNKEVHRKLLLYCKEKELSDNTAGRHISKLKTFLNWCETNELIHKKQYKDFHEPSAPTNLLYLQKSELFQFRFVNVSENPILQASQDLALFAAYTGLRISDVLGLKKFQVITKESGTFLNVVQHKTRRRNKKAIQVYLLDFAKEILDKHKNDHNTLCFGPVAEKDAQETINASIKEIGKLAKINSSYTEIKKVDMQDKSRTGPKWEFLTFHVMRSTFSMMLEDLPIEVRSMLLGHSDVSVTLKHYNKFKIEKHIEKIEKAFKI